MTQIRKLAISSFIGTLAFGMLLMSSVRAATLTRAIDAISELAGTYTGHWDMYGIDKTGSIKLIRSWDDVITLSDPKIDIDPFLREERAFGLVTDQMTFKFPAGIPNMTAHFTEGFKVLEGGAPGDHYFTYKDRTGAVFETVENQIAPNLWSYESAVDLKAYAALGISADNVIAAKNFTVKSITVEDQIETQTVSQTTTLVLRSVSGAVLTKQFVSMSGIHRRLFTH